MIPNHPEPEQILLENVLFALGNPLRLSIIRRLADGSELSCNALRPEEVVKSTMMAAAGLAFGLSHTLLQQVVIIGATPSAIAAGMFALRSDTYIDTASSSILIGTAVGVVTEGIMIYLIS
jgi:Predicted permeases